MTAPYADVYLVDPTEKLFAEMGNKFIALQAQVFGTDHIYNCDTYNEMQPPTSDPAYLAKAWPSHIIVIKLAQHLDSRCILLSIRPRQVPYHELADNGYWFMIGHLSWAYRIPAPLVLGSELEHVSNPA